MVLDEWFDFKKCDQRERKCRNAVVVFRRLFFLDFFQASLGKFGQKSFAPPKIYLLLHLRCFNPLYQGFSNFFVLRPH